MKKKLQEILNNVMNSLNTSKAGWSARKLTAFSVMACVIMAHGAWLKTCFFSEDFSLLSEVLIIDYSFVAALLGMTTYQNIKQDEKKDNESK